MMQLLAHRGYWLKATEKNTKQAITDAFAKGWGVETDFRDCAEQIVIAHDLAKQTDYAAEYVWQQYNEHKSNACIAINIKADGLSEQMQGALLKYQISNYFVFDMSIPETLRYLKLGLNVFVRCSEYEIPNQELLNKAKGIWLDAFTSTWFQKELIDLHLLKDKQIAIVSCELHGRNHLALWAMIKENNFHLNRNVLLCTDLPHEAKQYFSTL
jgi:glycerophosphoryl diester phosphodiesterase